MFLAAWQRWDSVLSADQRFAYGRRIMVNIAVTRLRRITTERRRLALVHAGARRSRPDPILP